ncbi:hypothetical protein P3342_011188 [Pyrenophora teres f. teres]|uniref:Aminoglycoside phosphotransferase n=1 Tax=Pyrenophora teres f. teres TaxID=97479 RepID=A0A6S6WDJ7_9PLEO|nr:hypothetical protein P3342_011188 [Pyrenophora teres f. teres]CAE7207584.1 Aminoglycoside phosphotransferase [Pyrenophora teres f. teres]
MGWFRKHFFKASSCAEAALSISYPPSNSQRDATDSYGVHTISDCDVEQLFKYTTARWLWNEEKQFARRYVEFDLSGLVHVSTQALGARSCVSVTKVPEGNFSKVFLLTMDDGRGLIAKLPNPNAGRPYFTTASEMATMDYVRNVLGIPAPEVYGYSTSTDNPVKAEYILMERSKGIELGKLWDGMRGQEKHEILKALVDYEVTLSSADWPMYGSLYYTEDLSSTIPNQILGCISSADNTKSFAVGPTTGRAFFDDGKDSIETSQGPCMLTRVTVLSIKGLFMTGSTIDTYIRSCAIRELACIEKFSSYPGQQGLFNGPNQYCPTKGLKISVLQDYLKVATKILPKDSKLFKPSLWHRDLHANNIFVDPSNPTKIVNIIDWQAVNISPLFRQARHPPLIEFEGPLPAGLKPIKLPDGYDDMTEEQKKEARALQIAQSLYKLYDIHMMFRCPDIIEALRFQDTLPGEITALAGTIFSDGEPILQGKLIQLQDKWDTIIGSSIPCPLSFTPEDRAEQRELEERWNKSVELMRDVLSEIGEHQPWNGWVNHKNYSIYKERLSRCREEFLDRMAKTVEERSQWARAWPFQDT